MWRAARSSSGCTAAESPEVPIKSGLPAAVHAARFPAVALAREKSRATSHSARTAASSQTIGTPSEPMPASSPMSRPSCALPSEVTAPAIRISVNSRAARTMASPILPAAPMIKTRMVPLARCAAGEEPLHTLEKSVLPRSVTVAVPAQQFFELADEFALLSRQIDRRFDHDPAEKVPARAAAHGLYALVAQTKDAARLSLGRNLDGHFAIECRHGERPSECGGRKAHRQLAAQVLAVALEDRMLADLDLHVEIPRGPTVATSLAFAAQPDTVAR